MVCCRAEVWTAGLCESTGIFCNAECADTVRKHLVPGALFLESAAGWGFGWYSIVCECYGCSLKYVIYDPSWTIYKMSESLAHVDVAGDSSRVGQYTRISNPWRNSGRGVDLPSIVIDLR